MELDLDQMQLAAAKASRLLKALANPHRLMILCQLVDGEKSVGELAGRSELAQSALSQHLARLRADGLVRTRREAQTIFYSLAGDDARQVIGALYGLYCEPGRRETV